MKNDDSENRPVPQRGKKETADGPGLFKYEIIITGTANQTWQGSLKTGHDRTEFHSLLELIRIISGYESRKNKAAETDKPE